MSYQGDYLAASTVVFNFNTASFSDGSPITLAGTPALSVYKNSTTESTAGITLTVDYDSRTGMHHVVIDTSADGTFYAAGNDFDVVITAGTVGGTSVVGRKVGSFSLENRTQKANVTKWNGTAVASPATAGIPEVNVKNVNNVSTSSVSAINANLGTTQPVNFDGTGASAYVKSSLWAILGTVLSETAGQIAAGFKSWFNVAAPTATMMAPADSSGTTTLLSRVSSARAGYLDNLNVGGNVASHADIAALNTSASKHLLLVTVGQYEPGETYTVECRTFSAADGSAVNADSTPTLTATGQVSGSLAANLSAATNPATGVYRWTYTPGASPTLEQIRFDVSATISSSTFTLSAYSQTVAEATVVWTATDQSHLTSIYNKLPTNNIADETLLLSAIGSPQQVGTKYAVTLAPADVSGNLPANVTQLLGTAWLTPAVAGTPDVNAKQIGGAVPGSAVIGTVGTVTNGVTVSGSVTVGGYAAGQDPATLVLDVAASTHNTANSIGAKINTAASAGDPWATNEPGSYASGTFGNLVANALTSTNSWIFAAASYTAPSVPAALGTPRQIANTPYTKTFTANDLRTAIADQLVDSSTNSPINLTGSTVTFRMISQADKSVKINNASATLTDAPNGKVAYSWTGTDLDTAGLYWGWWLVTTGGKTEHFPGDGEKMTVKVVAAE